jgi:uncharacterized iron-regulated protein
VSDTPPEVPPLAAHEASVVFLGEQHDNPAHHEIQAAWVAALQPAALVFEMLTPEQAARIMPGQPRDAGTLADLLEWEASGWPDFAMYHPIFVAAPDARIRGAGVPRDTLRALMQGDGGDAAVSALRRRFALDQPLPTDQQERREILQAEAHCDALPTELLPAMVEAQRLRDAALADAALAALEETGGPVVVITGNGHAREDWGAPFLLRRVSPETAVFSLGQGEAGAVPEGGFGTVLDGPTVDRGDPCAAFR